MLDELAHEFAPLGPPIIVFNKSHSGSRVLALLLARLGVFIGADRNESEDAVPILDLVHFVVNRHVPQFSRLFTDGDSELPDVTRSALRAHLAGHAPPQRWGWKLCETVYMVPVLARVFPKAYFVHLVRDGRDVAFADHVAPKAPFWRKVYFETDQIERWLGLPMTNRAYRSNAHIFNARHWVTSVSLGRAYGAMLGDRYIEVRYEDLVADLPAVAGMLCRRLALEPDPGVIADLTHHVHSTSVGKWRRQPEWKIQEALSILEPTLSQVGYGEQHGSGPLPRRSWLRRKLWSLQLPRPQ